MHGHDSSNTAISEVWVTSHGLFLRILEKKNTKKKLKWINTTKIETLNRLLRLAIFSFEPNNFL